jgi:hypothetical protein
VKRIFRRKSGVRKADTKAESTDPPGERHGHAMDISAMSWSEGAESHDEAWQATIEL